MVNLTISALSLSCIVGQSPLLALSSRSNFQIFSSQFSRISSPLLLSYSFPGLRSNILFDNLLFSHTITNLATCKTLAERPSETSLYSGCVTATDTNYSFQDTTMYDLTGVNLTITNCFFSNCTTGLESLFSAQNTLLNIQNTSVINCSLIFITIDGPNADSLFKNVSFVSVLSPIVANDGSMRFVLCHFNYTVAISTTSTNDKNSYMTFSQCTTISFESCLFEQLNETAGQTNLRAIYVENTIDLRIRNCNFNTSSQIAMQGISYAIITNSCFGNSQILDVINEFTEFVVLEGNAVNKTCPFVEQTVALTTEKRAYAITTVVVFSLGFAALFITLITLVFCKADEEVTKYGKLHQDALVQEEIDEENERST